MRQSKMLAAFLVPFLMTGCDDGAGPSEVLARLMVLPQVDTIAVGGTLDLAVQALDGDDDEVDLPEIVWSSSDPTVAAVTGEGVVSGDSPGTATVRATAASAPISSASAEITVLDTATANVVRIGVEPGAATLQPSGTVQIVATAFGEGDERIAVSGFEWSSSNTSVASVSAAGVVTAVGQGDAAVTASLPGSSSISATADVVVEGPATLPQGVLFHSDWSTATGVSEAALRDTNKPIPWTQSRQGQLNILEVVPATGLGFPQHMENVLAVEQRGERSGEVKLTGMPMPIPEPGEHRYYRIYMRYTGIDDQPGFDHSVEYGPFNCASLGALQILPQSHGIRLGTSWYTTAVGTGGGGDVHARLDALAPYTKGLQRHQTYRIEWHLYIPEPNKVQLMEFRVYDTDDVTLLYGPEDFDARPEGTDWEEGVTLANTKPIITLPTDTDHGDGINCLGDFLIGSNGPVNWTDEPGAYRYYGGFMVRDDTWAGPY